MNTLRVRIQLAVVGLAIAAVLVISGTVAGPADAAAGDGGFTAHPSLVPETPERGYPIILDTPTFVEFNPNCPQQGCVQSRQTFAVDMIDRYIISGGDFLNVELQNGTTVSQPYLAIFDSATKELVCTNLDVNSEVLAIAPGPLPRTAIIGGRFSSINGADGVTRSKSRLAMIHLDTCEVDADWTAGYLSARVTEFAVNGSRLFVGGDFTTIAGTNIERLAEVSHADGTLNPNFSFTFEGERSRAIVGMEANSAGTRLAIIHRTTSIDGQSMRGTAVFDISNPSSPTLTDHRLSTNTVAYNRYYDIQDGAVSPDFSRIGIVQGTSTNSDYATLVPTTETTGQLSWQHFLRDSAFGVAISNNAVYVSGHFCKIDAGPGATDTLAPNSGPSSCTGSTNFAGGAWRTQLAALRISDGTPLNWNPGNDAGRGGTALTVVSRGLLSGFDGDRTDNFRTGTTAFFDFGAPDDPRADQTCAATDNGDGSITLDWTAIPGENSYVIRRNGSWLTTPGNVLTYTESPDDGTFTYVIRSRMAGTTTNTTCTPTITIDGPNPGAQTCDLNVVGGDAVLTWTAIPGENNYIIRRNNSWLATVGNTLTFTDTNYSAGDSYVIRSRMAGTTTNTTC